MIIIQQYRNVNPYFKNNFPPLPFLWYTIIGGMSVMKIYPYLRLLWLALAGSALINLAALSPSMTVLMAANVLNLACYGLAAYVLYRLSDEAPLFTRAFQTQLLSIALIGLALVCTQFAPGNVMLLNFLSLLSLAGSVAGLLSEYYLYWGLDQRIIPCGYAYPARRIRWCLYAPLIGAFLSSILILSGMSLIGVLVQLAFQFVPLVLLWQYMKAVREREDSPLTF